MRPAFCSGHPRRNGFVMLTVLWAIVVASTLVLATALAGRDAFNAGRNRLSATRAFWVATACAERTRASMDSALRLTSRLPARSWRDMEAVVAADPDVVQAECAVNLEAAGTRLDVNAATTSELARLFTALGRADADALTDAVEDWRDTDDVPRSAGAERDWYQAQARSLPRNGAIADDGEIVRIRGLEDGFARGALSSEPGHISIATAPAAVLAALPGFTDEAVNAVLAMRTNGNQVEDLAALAYSLSSAGRDSLVANFQDLTRRATLDPEAWIVTATGWSGYPAVSVRIELRLVRANRHTVLSRRRVRP